MLHCSKHPAVQRPFTPCDRAVARKPRISVRARTSDYDRLKGLEDSLASEFSAHINELSLKAPLQHRRPSPLDPPTAAVAAQLDALQINDWPEPDAGVHTAMAFAKPYDCEQLSAATPQHYSSGSTPLGTLQQQQRQRHSGASGVPQQHSGSESSNDIESENERASESVTRVRSWAAREEWLTPQQFVQQLHSPPYDVLLGCDSWRACSNMVFPATRVGQRAVQAVEVLAVPRQHATQNSSSSSSSSEGGSSGNGKPQLQKYTFSFCLELVHTGPYKGCWMTVGVRPGNYST